MERYKNLSGGSGVSSFEIGSDYIRVRFERSIKTYQYSYRKAGSYHVERMKGLAQNGSGLNSYIKTYVNDLYD
ncbi:hypothetical protein GCM10011506_35960 [Marivirga lumbricoides]|uniref:KTSC domain-containing protein n=1 Tax=Marivirga lumbricoides TaxID=1046115 RepID=A0A2T4DR60_9BACT|nr:hypothetical protein C9994_08395 [Marivirga lumbricoides]GGC47199.1 hypothetical protein GCM10011506_35960 [Marivirga lumbricoides]